MITPQQRQQAAQEIANAGDFIFVSTGPDDGYVFYYEVLGENGLITDAVAALTNTRSRYLSDRCVLYTAREINHDDAPID